MNTHHVQVYGHRGAAGEAPENTIAGCRHAIERGVRRIEIDLRLSSDGELIIIHDASLNRTTFNKGKANTYTSAQLKHVDARAFGPQWPNKKGTGVPTLEALLDATPEIKQYQLEVKSGNAKLMLNIAQKLAKRFENKLDAKRIIVTSTNTRILRYVGELAPHIKRGIVATKTSDLAKAKALRLDYFCANWSLCELPFIKQLRSTGMHVSVWTVNEPSLIKKLHKLKVDSIISDYPSMAIPLLSKLER